MNNFAELMDEIAYAWDGKSPRLTESGNIVIGKLVIQKDKAQYKEETYQLAEGVYEKALQFIQLFT